MRGLRPQSPDSMLTQFDAGLRQRMDVELTALALVKTAMVRRDAVALRQLRT